MAGSVAMALFSVAVRILPCGLLCVLLCGLQGRGFAGRFPGLSGRLTIFIRHSGSRLISGPGSVSCLIPAPGPIFRLIPAPGPVSRLILLI